MKLSFSVISDCLFSAFIAFVLSLILFNYIVGQPYATVIAATLAALIAVLSFNLLLKNNKIKALKKEEQAELDKMLTQFNFSTNEDNLSFFCSVFTNLGYSVEKKKGGIFFKDKSVAVFIVFGFSSVNKSDVVKIFNLLRKDDIGYIISESFSPEISSFISRFNNKLVAVDGASIYKFLKDKNALPTVKFLFTEKKQKGIKLLKNLLYKNKAKNYMVFGLVFLLMSYFFAFKLYYVIVGTLFLFAALFTRLFGLPSNQKEQN